MRIWTKAHRYITVSSHCGYCNRRKWTCSACLLLNWVADTTETQIAILGSLTNYRRTHLQLFTRILPRGLSSATAANHFSDQNASSTKTLRAPYLFTLLALTSSWGVLALLLRQTTFETFLRWQCVFMHCIHLHLICIIRLHLLTRTLPREVLALFICSALLLWQTTCQTFLGVHL